MDMGECPGNTIGVKAIGYPGILVNITRVVVVNEVKVRYGVVEKQGGVS